MKILTNKKYKKLCDLIAANQIILNSIGSLNGIEALQAYSKSVENCCEIFMLLGGEQLANEAKNIIFNWEKS